MKVIVRLIMLAVAYLAAVSAVSAQPWHGSGGWGMRSPYQRMYNPATVETISGEVTTVDKVTPMKGMGYGIHVVLKTDKETVQIHLGPGWFIERQDISIAKGDRIEIKGSRILIGGKPVIIAAEVRKDKDVLVLRNSAGIPVWSGWRR